MQRVGKITLGVTLIILGSVKLWDVFRGEALTPIVVRFWPAVLVFFGLEYLWANRNPESRAGLHWGAVFLTFLIIIGALGVTGYANFRPFIQMARYTNVYHSSIPVTVNYPVDTGIKRLEIETIGDITLRGENVTEITGQGFINISARSEEEARQVQEKVHIEKDLSGDTLIIRVFRANDFPKTVGVAVKSLDLVIPFNLDVKVRAVSGDVSIKGSKGNLDVSTVSGNVDIKDDLSQSLRIHTISGDVDTILSSQTKEVTVKTTSGDIEIRAPQDTGGKINVRTVSGDIDVPKGDIRVSSSPGSNRASGTFGAGQTNIDVETISGDVTIR